LEVLLRESGYPPKSVARNGSAVTYFKQSDQIEDFLTLIGAPAAAMRIMSTKVEKGIRNSVNRRLNCDSANLDKAVEAAQNQGTAIRKLEAAGRLKELPDKLQETAALRLGGCMRRGVLRNCRTSSRRRRPCGWRTRS